jgi:hypothetical protein
MKGTIMSNTYIKAGYTLANKLEEADVKAGNTKRKLLLSVVNKYKSKEEINHVLTGFEQYHIEHGASPQTVAVRKSEIMTIFKAALKGGEDNIKSLEAFTGTYHAWLSYARTLKGKRAEDQGGSFIPTERKQRTRKLTEKGAERVKSTLMAANDAQVISLFSDLTQSLVDKDKDEGYKSILLVIQKQAELLARTKTFSKEVQSIGHKILEIVVPALTEEIKEPVRKVA